MARRGLPDFNFELGGRSDVVHPAVLPQKCIEYTRIDANTIEAVTKLKGKATIEARAVVSGDGKTRTLTQTGKDAQGHDLNNVLVYEKQ